MQKTSVILTCALFFGALGTSEAHPLDSSDIVYIDGEPCNSACQSYMAWSRQITMPNRPALVPPRAAARQKAPRAVTRRAIGIGEARSKPAAHGRIANEVAPKSTEAPQAKITDLQPGGKAAAASDAAGAKIADLRRYRRCHYRLPCKNNTGAGDRSYGARGPNNGCHGEFPRDRAYAIKRH